MLCRELKYREWLEMYSYIFKKNIREEKIKDGKKPFSDFIKYGVRGPSFVHKKYGDKEWWCESE